MAKLFLVSWDAEGVEAVVDITGADEEATVSALSGKLTPELQAVDTTLWVMTRRARYNPSRWPEIYVIGMTFEISAEELKQEIKDNPSHMLPLIRSKGRKIHGSPPPRSQFNGGKAGRMSV